MNNITNKIIPILKNYNVKKAALFGSYIRNEQTNQSDIDLLVELPESLSLIDVIAIQQDIEDSTGKSVDLVEYEALKPAIRNSVLSQAQVIYEV
ncbi:MAG: hypothetical protein KatS3mg087_0349 [Patescibacteria group bacterium]|nr:MAG: hypothetical protein KatS3mg087_0349 [Patescibacteria group bacterium]